jgi:hypothetical protein
MNTIREMLENGFALVPIPQGQKGDLARVSRTPI